MRIFKNKWFSKFASKAGLTSEALKAAVSEMEAGNIHADLGGNVYKQRIARRGQGKSGGYRTVVIVKHNERAFFVYGFEKKKLDDISEKALEWYKEVAKSYLLVDDIQLNDWLLDGTLKEVF